MCYFVIMENVKYLLSGEQDLSRGLAVTTVGHQQIGAGAVYPLVEHPSWYCFQSYKGRIPDEFQLVCISRGRGCFVSDSVRRCGIHEGTMLLLFPGKWHSYAPDPPKGWCESWIGFLDPNMDNRRTARFLSSQKPLFQVGMSYSWFRRMFREYTGFVPEQYLRGLRVSKARELLVKTDLSCRQIAYETGFETPAYFNAVFLESTDRTPARYRKMACQKQRCEYAEPEPCT